MLYEWLGTDGKGGTKEILGLIMEYHAYTMTVESEKKIGVNIGAKYELETVKYRIKTQFDASWILEELEK